MDSWGMWLHMQSTIPVTRLMQWSRFSPQLCQEYFEYTPGVLRAYVKPKHLDALTFTLQPVIEALVLG